MQFQQLTWYNLTELINAKMKKSNDSVCLSYLFKLPYPLLFFLMKIPALYILKWEDPILTEINWVWVINHTLKMIILQIDLSQTGQYGCFLATAKDGLILFFYKICFPFFLFSARLCLISKSWQSWPSAVTYRGIIN